MSNNPNETIEGILDLGPVMPVIVIDDTKDALPLADALLAGGLKTIEITLRTPAALGAIEAIASQRPEIRVGAGTVVSASLAKDSSDAGATFAVSPGTTPAVVVGCATAILALLPGASTVSELMTLHEAGFTAMKFFPASAAGGTASRRSVV